MPSLRFCRYSDVIARRSNTFIVYNQQHQRHILRVCEEFESPTMGCYNGRIPFVQRIVMGKVWWNTTATARQLPLLPLRYYGDAGVGGHCTETNRCFRLLSSGLAAQRQLNTRRSSSLSRGDENRTSRWYGVVVNIVRDRSAVSGLLPYFVFRTSGFLG